MPLVHFVLFKTTLRIKENLLALHEDSLLKHQFTPSWGTDYRVNDSSISHFIHTSISFPTLISFIPLFFTSFIYILLYFASFRFLLLHFASFRLHFASFRLHFASFRLHFASFRIISLHFASFRFISYFSRTPAACRHGCLQPALP